MPFLKVPTDFNLSAMLLERCKTLLHKKQKGECNGQASLSTACLQYQKNTTVQTALCDYGM